MEEYVIQSGDTIAKIARYFGVSVDDILQANSAVTNPNSIAVGQRLQIPLRNRPDTNENDPEYREIPPDEVPWLEIAAREVAPPIQNSHTLVRYRRSCMSEIYAVQNLDWCAAFVNWCLKESGYGSSGSGRAKSFLQWRGTRQCNAKPGAIAVFDRGGNLGHCGFYVGQSAAGKPAILGGNQRDRETGQRVVCISEISLPIVGYRWPMRFYKGIKSFDPNDIKDLSHFKPLPPLPSALTLADSKHLRPVAPIGKPLSPAEVARFREAIRHLKR